MPALRSHTLIALPPAHREALQWFHDHAGLEVAWPKPLANGTFLVNKAKGIHKPAGSEYALSIRQSLNGPYPDRDPIVRPDGSWSYEYFQERPDPSRRDSMFTNRALLACQRDQIPVGVIRQVKAKPNPRYQVLGLALVKEWENGYFNLESYNIAPQAPNAGHDNMSVEVEPFDPENIEDARTKVLTQIVRRQGQGKFRAAVLAAYNNRCAITNCDLTDTLEAAHIFAYLGEETNVVANGLLLRGDLHTLYDLGLIAIDSECMKVFAAPKLRGTAYSHLHGLPVRLPTLPDEQPNHAALELHFKWANSKWAP